CATPRNPGEYTAHAESRSRLGEQPLARAPACLGAMADAVFLLRGDFRKALAERGIEEDRIVAEAAGTARRREKYALHHALHRRLASVSRTHDGDQAAEACTPALRRHAGHLLEHRAAALGIGEIGAAIARGEHAGPPTERVHFDARVIGKSYLPGRGGHRARLAERVLCIGRLALRRQGNAGKVREV